MRRNSIWILDALLTLACAIMVAGLLGSCLDTGGGDCPSDPFTLKSGRFRSAGPGTSRFDVPIFEQERFDTIMDINRGTGLVTIEFTRGNQQIVEVWRTASITNRIF